MHTDDHNNNAAHAQQSLRHSIQLALVLALGAAVSLGVTRFSYALLLPPMRADLAWSYTLAGGMNTSNAVGYLLGAMTFPPLFKRYGAARVLLVGALWAFALMLATGFFTSSAPLLLQRLLAGVVSAWMFVAGGLLAAQLGARQPTHSGLLLGIYYGGVGLGIALSSLLVPAVAHGLAAYFPKQTHAWAWAWWALAVLCAVAAWLMYLRRVDIAALVLSTSTTAATTPTNTASSNAVRTESIEAQSPIAYRRRDFSFALLGYACFGAGYIGYMTFIIALLREQAASTLMVTVFYTLLGVAVMASSRLWAKLLDRYKGGQALALLDFLLGCAIIIPAITPWQPALIVSGVLFGAVFLSIVASTTALVRHNWPASHWPIGISAFTIAFAIGQIVGPTLVGYIADSAGGLTQGLLLSAITLWVGALLAWQQKALLYK
ncbi:MAG TPA: YbfB/YjiJ family MFS transporter [Burkholderiaceae bacterium]|nr:YbfB/YjiJ family MFS transporter [Burkholderiaceae bacterium]